MKRRSLVLEKETSGVLLCLPTKPKSSHITFNIFHFIWGICLFEPKIASSFLLLGGAQVWVFSSTIITVTWWMRSFAPTTRFCISGRLLSFSRNLVLITFYLGFWLPVVQASLAMDRVRFAIYGVDGTP